MSFDEDQDQKTDSEGSRSQGAPPDDDSKGKPAATVGSFHICPKTTGNVPHVGGPGVTGSPNIFIGGLPAMRVGDSFHCNGPYDTVAKGSSSVSFNGEPAARVGDGTEHKGSIQFGNSTVLIGDRGKAILEPGSKGSWNATLNGALFGKCDYMVADYVYKTDEHGRIVRVEGELRQLTRDRNTYQQRRAGEKGGIKDGLARDQGGHLVAAIFDGPGEQINYAPMDANLNQGAWKRMENKWAKALGGGKTVKVDIRPIYEGDNKRPTAFDVFYEIDEVEEFESFGNRLG